MKSVQTEFILGAQYFRPPFPRTADWAKDLKAIARVLVIVAAGCWAGPAFAIDSAGTGFWDVGATWVGGVVPTGGDDVTITNGCTVTIRTNTANNVKSLIIETNGVLTHTINNTTALGERYKVVLSVTNNLTIDLGGKIDVNGKGYTKGEGPGKPVGIYVAGSYGGESGAATSGTTGPTYGSVTAPTNLGSGGGSWAGCAHYGGGAVILAVAGTTTVNGVISAVGVSYVPEAFVLALGSGGSIFLTTGRLTGSGTLMADGGRDYGYSGYSGGGGRIAVILINDTVFGNVTIHAYGGNANPTKAGGAGTIYLETQTQGPNQGTLMVDAGNRGSNVSTLIGSNVTDTIVGTVIVTNAAKLAVGNQVLTVNADWDNKAICLGALNGTVKFAGTNAATVKGHSTFYNLVCTNATKVLTFEDGTTNAVVGTLTLANTTLDSTSGSASWHLQASGNTHSVSNVTVGRSDARSGATIEAYDSTDLGGNFKWVFAERGFNTNTWTGTTDPDWDKTNNWSLHRSTIFTDTVVIPSGCPNYPLMDFDKRMLSLSISNGASMSLNGYNLTVDEDTRVAGTLTAVGSAMLTLGGDLDFSGGAFTPASSTVLLSSTNAQSVVSAGNTFYQLTIDNGAAPVVFSDAVAATRILNLGTPVTFVGSVTVASSFQTEGTNVIFGGSVTAPEFHNTDGALMFSGIVATVTFTNWQGDLTFRDDFSSDEFYCEPGGMALTFNAGKTYTIGNFDVHGDRGDPIQLRSSTTSHWYLNVTNWAKVRHADVQYSDALGGQMICPLASTDSGSNSNWDFGGPWQTWVGGVSDVFTNGSNWAPVGVPDTNADLLIDGYYTTAPVLLGVATVAQVVVGGYTTLTVTVNGHLTVLENMDILPDAIITHSANSTTALGERYKIVLSVGGNLTIDPGAQINVNGKGYTIGQGPGRPLSDLCGGSYGGVGGAWTRSSPYGTPGPTYGSIIAPTNIGSGGQNGPGGGAVILEVAGAATINGVISAVGDRYVPIAYPYDSGSGGSVFLTTGVLTGNGTMTADGGFEAGYNRPTGGGGRISVILTNSTDFGNLTMHAYGGNVGAPSFLQAGAAGTVYLRTQAQSPDQGTLLIDAGDRPTVSTTLISSNVSDTVFGTVTITNKAIVEVAANQSLTVNGSWLNTSTFIGTNTGATVIFAGTNAAMIEGHNTFYNLTAGASGKTILFEAGKTNTVKGMLIFQDDTILQSTLDDTQWWLTLSVATGTQLVGRVIVKDSNASLGQEILAGKGSRDLKNNVNWWFPPRGSVIVVR